MGLTLITLIRLIRYKSDRFGRMYNEFLFGDSAEIIISNWRPITMRVFTVLYFALILLVSVGTVMETVALSKKQIIQNNTVFEQFCIL